MRLLIQRVTSASVVVEEKTISAFDGQGLLVLCGIAPDDTLARAEKCLNKLLKLRIFEDENGAMNRSLMDVNGSLIFVSQFTLYADTNSGNRPGFSTAARPEIAEPLYNACCDKLRALLGNVRFGTGRFGADMKVSLVNDGPCTFLIES